MAHSRPMTGETYGAEGPPGGHASPLGIGEIVVGIVDDGFAYDHPLLGGSILRELSVDHVDGDANDLLAADSRHGMAVAGVIAGTDASIDAAAPGVTIAGHRIAFGSVGLDVVASALGAQVAVDVSNNSWSFSTFFGDDFRNPGLAGIAKALEDTASHGRDALGTSVVFSAGNARRDGDNVNHHNLQNSEFTIAVGAVDGNGRAADFSTPGAAVLLSAPGVGVRTTDRVGAEGYGPGDLVTASGTSFAAPAVSGTVARMYAANPGLGYRDVQEILALTAATTDAGSPGWQENGAATWNAGGLSFHHRYGYGVLDADAAVRLAETWTAQSTAADRVEARHDGGLSAPVAIPDDGRAAAHAGMLFDVDTAIEIDRVLVDLDIAHGRRGDLVVRLISPHGTESVLIDRPGLDPATLSGFGDTGRDIRFQTTSVAHVGEVAPGLWELRVEDWGAGIAGRLEGATLTLVGDPADDDDLHVFTDDFAAVPGPALLHDATGRETLNLAALSDAAVVDLAAGSATLAGRELAISAETDISTVFGGGGGDSIAGSEAGERLFGGWDDDVIEGRGGDDTLTGGPGDDTLDGGAGHDTALFDDIAAAFAVLPLDPLSLALTVSSTVGATFGRDLLVGIERLSFADGVFDAVSFFPDISPEPEPEPDLASPAALDGLAVWFDARATSLPGDADRLVDLSGAGNDAIAVGAATRAEGGEGWRFDGGDRYQIADSADINTGGPYAGKTFAFVVDTGADIASRQVLYEQGGAARGISIYLEAGQMIFNAWNRAEAAWGPASAMIDIAAGERTVVAFRLDASAGTLSAWKNGAPVDEVAGVGTLFGHFDDIGLGDTAGSALAADGTLLSGGFEGMLHEAALFDRSLDTAEIDALTAYLAGKWTSGAPEEPAASPLSGLDALVLHLDPPMGPRDSDADGALDLWNDASLTGNAAVASSGAVEVADGAVLFDGGDRFVFADAPTLNLAPTTAAKSITVLFAADAVTGRQVIYEQGGALRGLLLAIDDGDLVWRGWNRAETPWEAETRTPIEAGRIHAATGVFDANGDRLALHLDGAEVDAVTGTGLLYAHWDDVGLGGVAGRTLFSDGAESAALGYRGALRDFAVQDSVADDATIHAVHAALLDGADLLV